MQLQLVTLMILEYGIQQILVKHGLKVQIEQLENSDLFLYLVQMELQLVIQVVQLTEYGILQTLVLVGQKLL